MNVIAYLRIYTNGTCMWIIVIEGSLEVKLPTIWTDEKQRWEESEKRREEQRERVRRKKVQVREKVGTSQNIAFFQWFVAPEGRKVGSLKRRCGASWPDEMKNCTPLWREAHLQVKKLKAPHVRTNFGSWDVEKVHAVVARSTFRSQNVKNTRDSDHFWTLRYRFAWHAQGIVDRVQIEQSVEFCNIFNNNHHYTPIHFATTATTPSLHSTTLHHATLHYTPLRYTTLNYTQFRYTTLHSLHYTTLQSTTLHYNYTTFHYTTLHYTTLNYTTLHYITPHYTTLHYTPLHYTQLHYTLH